LRRQRFDQLGLQIAYESAYDAMSAVIGRRDRLDAQIAVMATNSEFTPVVNRLGCLRGISTLTGFGLAVEIGDWHRLDGRRIGAYLGMAPSIPRADPGLRAASPRPETPTPAGC
jgi:transposase